MASPQPVLHIGLPKAASTTLQQTILKNHPDILYVDNEAVAPRDVFMKLLEELIAYPSDMSASRLEGNHFYRMLSKKKHEERVYDKQFVESYYATYIKPVVKDKVFVFSRESCSVGTFNPHKETAKRLYSFCPEAKILLILRNPYSILKSRYIAMHKGIGSKIDSLPDFSGWLRAHHNVKEHHQSMFQDIAYGSLAEIYSSQFGKENVNILLLEDMINNKKEYVKQLASVLGVDEDICMSLLGTAHKNKAISKPDFFIKRFYSNKFLHSLLPSKPVQVLLKLLIKGKIELTYPPDMVEEIKKFCTEDYKVLVEKWHLPLDRYGYFGD